MRRIVLLLFFVFNLSLCGDVMASGIKDDDIVTIPIEKTGEEEQEKNENANNTNITADSNTTGVNV